MFQARKWGWKRIATRLLLVPVLTGGAAVAVAQTGPMGPTAPPPALPTAPAAPTTNVAPIMPVAPAAPTGTPAVPVMPVAPAKPVSPVAPVAGTTTPAAPPAATRPATPPLVPASAAPARPVTTTTVAPVRPATTTTVAPVRPAGTPVSQAKPPVQGMQLADPKAVMKEGRKALAEGRFNDAQDLAQRAESLQGGKKWGLFDDTPNSLLKDVQAARGKAEKAEADRLVKQARSILAKPPATPAEAAANLNEALRLCRRAEQLHGPYSMWEFGDRADKMARELEAALAKVPPAPKGGAPVLAANTPAPKGGAPAPKGGTPPANATAQTPVKPLTPAGDVKPAGATAPAAVAAAAKPEDAKKAAQRLLLAGRQAADAGDFKVARAKFAEAGKLNATFGPNEYNPDFALQELNARGAEAVSRYTRDADVATAKKDFGKADGLLKSAAEVTAALNLFPRPVEDAKTNLRFASGGTYGGPGPMTLAKAPTPAPTPVATAPVMPAGGPPVPAAPVMPTAVAVKPVAPAAPTMPAVVTPTANVKTTGKQLLDQAELALRKGDTEQARSLAMQAHNLGGVQAEAAGLLNQVDAAVFARKQASALKSFDAAAEAHAAGNHSHALSVCALVDPKLLPAEKQGKHAELLASCKAAIDKGGDGVRTVSAADTAPAPRPTGTPTLPGPTPAAVPALPAAPTPPVAGNTPPVIPPSDAGPMAVNPPGTARVTAPADAPRPVPAFTDLAKPEPKPAADSLATQITAMREVNYQKFRTEGLKVQSDAQSAFGRGETDLAIQMLTDYSNRVRAAGLEPAKVSLLLRPVDNRLDMFRVMKGHTDALAREKAESREKKELLAGRASADMQKKAEVAKLMRQVQDLTRSHKYDEAEKLALQAKQLDPDDPAVSALAQMTKTARRVREYEKIKTDKESFNLAQLNNAEKYGPPVDIGDPLSVDIERSLRAGRRGTLDDVLQRTRTPAEYEIELKMERRVELDLSATPLEMALKEMREKTGLPIVPDYAAIQAEGLSLDKPITLPLPGGVSAKNALSLMLGQAHLSYVIDKDVVMVTTEKKSKGRLVTKVFSVADLVTPIPNFALPDYADIGKSYASNALNNPNARIAGLNMNAPPPSHTGLTAGQLAGSSPGAGGGFTPAGPGGTLQNTMPTAAGNPERNTKHEQLMKLVTGMVRPYTWDGMGGPGKVEYYDIGSAMVVNQTADVIREVGDLLEALRRLQDLAVAVEVRVISLSETFFERMGVDFAVNVKTNTTKFEPNLTNGVFRPEPFVNDINNRGVTVGLTPAGGGGISGPRFAFTPDLDVPIGATSFPYAIPGFGGYPNNPGANGGLSLGLAFLNDIQVFMFMEAAQGNRRVNVMQAPKLTLFNGQSSTISVSTVTYFVNNVQVYSVNGQIVFVPTNTPFPIGTEGGGNAGFGLAIQAVISADRRFVRLNCNFQLNTLAGATVPLFPITTFVTPVFEGGSQGVPIPFTQFIQQPDIATVGVNTTVVCPDGGTVLVGGLKYLGEGRNEFGPPFFSKIPYLNRLVRNTGIGRETVHLMLMITPRIIITAEEEIAQTEGGRQLLQP